MLRPHRKSTCTDTLFPYTMLFRSEQVGDVWKSEAGAIGAAQAEAVFDDPVEARLIVPVAAEQVIVRIAHRPARRQRLEEGRIGKDRHRQLEIGLLRGARSGDWVLQIGRAHV